MKKTTKSYDKLGMRLGMTLSLLFAGRRVLVSSLAQEYGVSERTIQLDLQHRLAYLPLETSRGSYWLEKTYLVGI